MDLVKQFFVAYFNLRKIFLDIRKSPKTISFGLFFYSRHFKIFPKKDLKNYPNG